MFQNKDYIGPVFIGVAQKGRGLVAVFRRSSMSGQPDLMLMDSKKLESRIELFESKGWDASQPKKALASIKALQVQKT